MRNVSFLFLFCFLFFSVNSQTKTELIQKYNSSKKQVDKSALSNQIGQAYFNEGNFKYALNYFFKFLAHAEKSKDFHNQGAACNNIACVYNETENYDKAIEFGNKALAFFKKSKNDLSGISDAYNTLGISHYNKYEDQKSYEYYKKSIYCDSLLGDKLSYAIKYRNLGAACVEMGMFDEGFYSLKKSLKIYEEFKDTLREFTLLVAISESYTINNQLDSTEVYLNKARNLVPFLPNNKSKMDDLYYSEYTYYQKQGKMDKALISFKKYVSLKDSIVNVESNKAMHDVQTKYETVKKDSKLKKQQLIIAQNKRNLIFISSMAFLALIIAGVIFYFIRSRHKLELKILDSEKNNLVLEKIIEGEEKERSRIAKELHDGVVQELTSVYLSLNLDSDAEKQADVKNQVKRITTDVRNLSHAMMPISLEEKGLTHAIEELFQRSLSPSNISYSFENFNLDERFVSKIEINVYRIIQELLNNVLKHSKATEVNCVIRQKDKQLILIFEDNGIGISSTESTTGMGLQNLHSRLKFVNGTIEMNSIDGGKGLYTLIRIPIA